MRSQATWQIPTMGKRAAEIAIVGLAVVLVTSLCGCTHLGSPELKRGSADYPKENPAPTHEIAIDGTVSSAFHLKIIAIYEGTIEADCWTSSLYSGGGFEGTASPLSVTIPIALVTDGGRFRGRFFADQFLPGKCGWHLHAVEAVLPSDKSPDGDVVIAQAADNSRYVKREDFDYSDSPSVLHMRYVQQVRQWTLVLKNYRKRPQGIDDSVHHIEVNIIDDGNP